MIAHTTSENVSHRELSGPSEVNVDTARNRNAVPHARDFRRYGSGVQRLIRFVSVQRIGCDAETDRQSRSFAKSRHIVSAAPCRKPREQNFRRPGNPSPNRRGQALVEFAVIALALYLILAAILTFGHLLYVAQGLQTAADLGAREFSRTPLPAIDTSGSEPESFTFQDALNHPTVLTRIYNPDFLVYDLDELAPDQSFLEDVIADWPILNRQLATMMIVDRPDFDGDGVPDANLIRYPGALLSDSNSSTGFTVGIPLVTGRNDDGVETIRWVPVVEEIGNDEPFRIDSPQRGIVALRINYPFQSAAMSSFRENPAGPFEPNVGTPNIADDGGVTEFNPDDRPGDLTGAPLESNGLYRGTFAGQYGLGAQGALGSAQVTGGRPVRPYRRVVSAQAIYRREIFQ